MKKLVLVKGLSYSTRNFMARKAVPFLVEDEMALMLIKTEKFKELGAPELSDTNDVLDLENPAPENLEPEKRLNFDTEELGTGGLTQEQSTASMKKDDDLTAEFIASMKKDELIALAAERLISIEDCKNNEERIERIQGALGLIDFAKIGIEE